MEAQKNEEEEKDRLKRLRRDNSKRETAVINRMKEKEEGMTHHKSV